MFAFFSTLGPVQADGKKLCDVEVSDTVEAVGNRLTCILPVHMSDLRHFREGLALMQPPRNHAAGLIRDARHAQDAAWGCCRPAKRC